MFEPGMWMGLWAFIAVVAGCGARLLGKRHRRLADLRKAVAWGGRGADDADDDDDDDDLIGFDPDAYVL